MTVWSYLPLIAFEDEDNNDDDDNDGDDDDDESNLGCWCDWNMP